MGPIALKMAKVAINEGIKKSNVLQGQKIEAAGVGICLSTEDQKEGVNAFF